MKFRALKIALLLPLMWPSVASAQTQDTTVNVALLPNTAYQVTADVSTPAVSDLVTLLQALGSTVSPIQILDSTGNLLGELPLQSLIETLGDATGAATREVSFLINSGVQPGSTLILRTIDSPLISVAPPVFQPVPPNQRPKVRINKRSLKNSRLHLQGIASDDGQIQRVTITFRGKQVQARGRERWAADVKLPKGRTRLTVRSFDNSRATSVPRRITVRVR